MAGKLTKQDMEKVRSYYKLLPKSIDVDVVPCEEGGYAARILNFPGSITEGRNFAELISMINWLVIDWLEIPEKYACFMPTYLPPLALAKKLKEFPSEQIEKVFKGEFSLVS